MTTRLNKYLATNLGISRREADDLIAARKIRLNGEVAEIGARVQDEDKVEYGRQQVQARPLIYLALNKPIGYVCSKKRQDETPTLYELLPEKYRQLKTVGRLDKDSSGLILLTNDGDFAFKMTHPSFVKKKRYELELDLPLAALHQQMIADFGIELADGPSKLALMSLDESQKRWQVEMSEGRNRQIRRTFAALGYKVVKLHRISFGNYGLGNLKSGEFELIKKS